MELSWDIFYQSDKPVASLEARLCHALHIIGNYFYYRLLSIAIKQMKQLVGIPAKIFLQHPPIAPAARRLCHAHAITSNYFYSCLLLMAIKIKGMEMDLYERQIKGDPKAFPG